MRVVAVIAASVLLATGCRREPDLKGGAVELVFAPRLDASSAAKPQRVAAELRDRVAQRVESSRIPAVVAADGTRLRVTVPAATGPAAVLRLKEILAIQGRLELRPVEDEALLTLAGRVPAGTRLATRGGQGEPRIAAILAADRETLDRAAEALGPHLPASTILAHQPPEAAGEPWQLLLLGPATVDNDGVRDAVALREGDRAVVAGTMEDEAAARFEALTRRWIGRRIAFVLDGEVLVAPYVMGTIRGGHFQVTLSGPDGQARANTLALVLGTRTWLPVPLELVEERTIPPAR